ncbi:MAG: DUF47 family protein [Candidatus Thermoplasmatota archaeon]|nr:DUF47 family protein [Candidatus Thermoplasmatota archaeon]MDP7264920.1 DUF47 family protein [Candidatus Thermoplasmatota archaeon]
MKLKTKLLESQTKMALKSVKRLVKCTEEYYLGNTLTVKKLQLEISSIEDKTDSIKDKAQLHWASIESDFRTKSSALELAARISLIADYAEDVALLFIMRNDSIPTSAWGDFSKFMEVVLNSVEKFKESILMARTGKRRKCLECEHFIRMYEGANLGSCSKIDENRFIPGFRNENQGCEVEEKESVYELCFEVSHAEDEADSLERRLRGQIYREEFGLGSIPSMHFLKIIENFDMIANTAEDCANLLKAMY